jgi:hypothetical protein
VRSIGAARDVLGQLKYDVRITAQELLEEAYLLGTTSAIKQLGYYGIEIVGSSVVDAEIISYASQGALSQLERQISATTAMVASGADQALILGDGQRLGVLQPAPVTKDLSQWIAWTVWSGFISPVDQYSKEEAARFKKQAVAALDDKTTDCCLKVHGQIKPIDQDFHLTGTPRYADYLPNPPFHWWCRTAYVLYQEEYDFGLTEELTSSAKKIMSEREAGGTGYRDPVSAQA